MNLLRKLLHRSAVDGLWLTTVALQQKTQLYLWAKTVLVSVLKDEVFFLNQWNSFFEKYAPKLDDWTSGKKIDWYYASHFAPLPRPFSLRSSSVWKPWGFINLQRLFRALTMGLHHYMRRYSTDPYSRVFRDVNLTVSSILQVANLSAHKTMSDIWFVWPLPLNVSAFPDFTSHWPEAC